MRIVVAPDSFKGSLTASEVARAIEEGIRRVFPDSDIVKCPLADGGEGTADLIIDHLDGTRHRAKVKGALGEKITAEYGLLQDETAVFDVASIVGLHLVPEAKRNPLHTTTYGIGQLIQTILDKGVRQFIIGLGGSSTNDGGIGMLQALGVRMINETGEQVPPNGSGLNEITHIDVSSLDERLHDCTFTVVTDVTNVLLGEKGATYVYGRQKGADDQMLQRLETGMKRYQSVINEQLGKNDISVVGSGAAGGLGMAFHTFLEADLKRGIDYMMELTNLEEKISQAHIVLTGEGKIDEQTSQGKVAFGVSILAKKYDVPVVAVVGANEVQTEKLYDTGMSAIFPIVQQPMTLEEALVQGDELIKITVENIVRFLKVTFEQIK